jgi:streptogramin lyase/two-component sensor histidine kinase
MQQTIIFDHYGAPQGFNASQALCLEKTKDGFLWIGTEQGLLRYDGHSFKLFRSDPLDSTTISSNYVRNILEDKHCRLWVSALPHLNIFDTKTGKSRKVNIPASVDNEKKLDIRTMEYDEKNDVIWLGTNKGLLYCQGKEGGLKQEIIPGKNIDSGIYDVEIDDQGVFWFAANDGLWRYDAEQCTVKNYHRPKYNSKVRFDDGFLSLYVDNRNKFIWIGSWVSGLMKFDMSTEKMVEYNFADKSKIQNGVITIQNTGFTEEENILWLGTTDGVKTFDIIDEKFYDFKSSNRDDIKRIPGAGFCFEPTDTEGMWIGTHGGLHRYDPYKQNVKVIDISLPDSQADWVLGDVAFEKGGHLDSILWFGLAYESFFKYDIVLKKTIPVPSVLKPYCNKVKPHTSYIDSKNVLWLSSEKKGFVGYDLTSGKLILPVFNIGEKKIPQILKILEDADGKLWLGSTTGMYILDRDKNEITEQHDIRRFLYVNKLSDFTYRFTIDTKGKVWIFATQKYEDDDTMYSFDPFSKDIKLFTQDKYQELKRLKSLESVESISPGKLMITSFNGFCVVDISTEIPTFTLFETYNDKPLGAFNHIAKDNKGNVWMSSDNGVTRFDAHTNTITNFTHFNSNMGMTHHPPISFSKLTNTLYLSQNLAINTINIEDLNMAKPGRVILSDMKILNFIFDVLPYSGQTLPLDYDQNSIDLHFSNMNFTNSQDNAYQYNLNEPDSEWINMTDNHLKFDNLGYGTYLLKVRAENSFGLKSPNEFELNIIISPPFWRTWWFNLLIIILISFIIFSFFKYRDAQRKKLDKIRHSIARDLHDDMGSTLSHIRMMSEREAMRKEANQSFQTIADKTEEVMNNMTEIIWSINPKNDSLKNIVGKIQEFAIDTLEPMGIEISFDIEEVPNNVRLNPEDRRHFYLIFKEAINNTAKYSKASKVHYSFKIEKGNMVIQFADDGLGFDPMLISRGNGLKNMASRAQALHGKIDIQTTNNGTNILLILKK